MQSDRFVKIFAVQLGKKRSEDSSAGGRHAPSTSAPPVGDRFEHLEQHVVRIAALTLGGGQFSGLDLVGHPKHALKVLALEVVSLWTGGRMQEHLSHRFKPANLLSGFRRACEVAPDRFETFRPRAAWWRFHPA